jgi:hypothetical protein
MAALFVALVLSMLALKSQRDELLAANVSVESRNLGGSRMVKKLNGRASGALGGDGSGS